jgi:hypothetical protein
MNKRLQMLAYHARRNMFFFSAVKLFKYLVIKTLDPELDPEPGPH